MTQTFSILAALHGLVSVGLLVLSCIPSLSAPGRGPLFSSITAFVAGKDSRQPGGALGTLSSHRGAEQTLLFLSPALSVMVAMVVYTSERWSQPGHPQIQTFFSWSFYLGWVSVPLFLSAGDCCPGSLGRPAGGYEGAGWG